MIVLNEIILRQLFIRSASPRRLVYHYCIIYSFSNVVLKADIARDGNQLDSLNLNVIKSNERHYQPSDCYSSTNEEKLVK